ncbi:MAG: (Fe-S)-binding protein [Promethearchaeota archaeon]
MTIDDYTRLQEQTMLCYQCSACNSVCPAFRIEQFSPRTFMLQLVNDGIEESAKNTSIWSCRGCSLCEICPMGIDIPAMVILARMKADKDSNPPPKTKVGHKQIFNLAQKIQANSTKQPKNNTWPRAHQKFEERGAVVLYTGILPIWDSLMYTFDLDVKLGLQAILEALNSIDIIPAIPATLKDSGHDLFYSGDEENFLKLIHYNSDTFHEVGAEKIIVVNPEDYHILKNVYPIYLNDFDFDVVFWTDVIVDGKFLEYLRMQSYLDVELTVSYHDPCKLGRINKIFDSPRILIENLPGVRLVKLKEERELAPCCGVSGFIGCDEGSLFLRKERLDDAKNKKCDIMVSTCPSCVSHYTCAMGPDEYENKDDPSVKTMQVMNLATLMAKRLYKFKGM